MLPHMKFDEGEDHVALTFDDMELSDFVDDILSEQFDLTNYWWRVDTCGDKESYVMYFPDIGDLDRIKKALASIDKADVSGPSTTNSTERPPPYKLIAPKRRALSAPVKRGYGARQRSVNI